MTNRIFALIICAISFCMTSLSAEPIEYKYQLDKEKLNFIVIVPDGFKLANGGMVSPTTMIGEHIPEAESIDAWSEMMTLMLDKNKYKPVDVVNMTVAEFRKSDPNSKIEINEVTESGLKLVNALVDHVVKPVASISKVGTNEILGIKALSNNQGTWIIQYAVRYDATTTSADQKAAIVEKVKSAMEKNRFTAI